MAEYVQQSVEEMLPELEQMERVGLFTGAETRKILKKRKNLEYKLRRRTKCKEDFMQYVQYEVSVLTLLNRRRKKLGYYKKKKDIEVAIVIRIHRIFRLATMRFPDDVKLWLSHIQFSKSKKEPTNVSKLFNQMLQIHTNKADLWILAAKWELENNSSPENARHLLQMGLRYLKTSKTLWLEYFRMELMNTEKLRQRRSLLGAEETVPEAEEVSDSVLEGLVAEIVYKKAIETIPDDVDFVLSFLPVCQLFDFTSPLQDTIFSDLKSGYLDKPQTWDALAKQHLHIKPYSVINEQKFHEVYEEALTQTVVPKDLTWKYYLTACLQLIEENVPSEHILEQRLHKILSLFTTSSEGNFLTEDLYLKWVKVLTNVGLVETAIQTLQKAVSQHSKSVLLWKQYLQLTIRSTPNDTEAIKIFKESQKHVPEKLSVPLWMMLLDFCVGCRSQQTEELFEKGINSCRDISLPVKEYYLQWTYLTKGIIKARSLFQRLLQTKPVSLHLFYEYFKIENSQSVPKIKFLRKAYEEAVLELGASNADIWIDFIKLEMNHPKGQPEKIGDIHFRAVKQLDGELNQQFITEFTLLQTGHSDLAQTS